MHKRFNTFNPIKKILTKIIFSQKLIVMSTIILLILHRFKYYYIFINHNNISRSLKYNSREI